MMASTSEQNKATVLESFDTLFVPESGVFSPRKKEVQMTNGAVALLWRRWASLMACVAAMDYSAADHTNDRIGGLEREVEKLKDELRRTRMSAGAADGGFEPSAPPENGSWRNTA